MAGCTCENWSLQDLSSALQDMHKDNKRIVVPMFQRGKRWKKAQEQKFIDSLIKGYPVGTMLFYETYEDNKRTYILVDGLQRGNSIKKYMTNPTEFFYDDSISDEFCSSVLNLVHQSNEKELYAKIRGILTTFIKAQKTFKNLQYFSVAKQIADEFSAGFEPIEQLIEVIKLFFEERQDLYDRIASTIIPVIVYTGDENNLPEIFDRINSQGTPLDQYEVYAAAWPVKQKFAIKNAEIVEYVVRKYDTFEEDDFKIHGYNREEMRTQKTVNAFEYRLPVVYVSKTYSNGDPVDIRKLAGRLKGVAHVLVQESTWLNGRIRRECDSKNEYYGAIGVYFPNKAYDHKKYMYRAYDGIDAVLSEKVIRSVIQYSNAQMMDKLYTWQGVSNALLRDRLSSKGAELLAAESEKVRVAVEADELIESVDEDIQKLKKQVEELTHANEILTYENQGLRSKMGSTDNMPILYLGEEEEFFQDEIRAILLDALEQALPNYASGTRRRSVLEDIIKSNNCKRRANDRSEQLKNLLRGYKTMSGSMKRTLQDIGFVITEEGKHYKFTYYGDGRYMATLAKTPSDNRSGMNIALEIIKDMF